MAEKKPTKPLKMKYCDNILKDPKSNKARDPEGIERIIFKSTIIGSKLKNSLLKMFNNIKVTI